MSNNTEFNEKVNNFLQTHKKSHFMQSPEWAKVKSHWKHEMICI